MNKTIIPITFEELKETSSNWSKAVIVFDNCSFIREFPLNERSYAITSDSKYFNSSKIGHSLFGDSLDGSDKGVRLDIYMSAIPSDNMGKRWIPEYCYITE